VNTGITLEELARELKGELAGDGSVVVKNIRDIEEAREGDLAILLAKKYEKLLEKTSASACVIPETLKKSFSIPTIKCKNPNLAFKKAAELILKREKNRLTGIHEKAAIGEKVTLGENVSVGAFAVLEDGCEVGSGTTISANTYVGRSVKIGKDCLIYPSVTILENVRLGDRVFIHSGSVLGSDGFGYERTLNGNEKIPHIGNIIIDDDVELGASVTIDRAKIAHTRIGKGTKVDNLVQIAHNVRIGSNCVIVAQCGISGSAKIGNNVIMGGQVGVVDHVEIGDNVMIAARSAIMKNVPSNTVMWGIPGRPLRKAKKIYALFDKLPDIYERLQALEKKVSKS